MTNAVTVIGSRLISSSLAVSLLIYRCENSEEKGSRARAFTPGLHSDASKKDPMDTIVNRRFGLVHATALNMNNMIGIGPFITIPLLMTALGGPQAMLGWLVALIIVMCDGMVWS